MTPTPDDPSEVEPPMTRALDPTEVDGAVAGDAPAELGATLPGATRPLAQGGEAWSRGAPEGPRVPGGASRRGVFGRIEPGQTLYSKYQVLRKLGGGAMGDVWLVRHASLKSQHALKVIVPNFATNAVALMRFQREFEVMATLRHEHAVTIYDACIDEDGGYIDMEFVEGQTIHEILGEARGKHGPGSDPADPLMPLGWIVRVLEQLCEVLQVAHEKGIVHRDLKPSNLMLLGGRGPAKEYLKVLDFGIAKIRDDPEGVAGRDQEAFEVRTQGFIGTPSYGSPEQAFGHEGVDGRSDLYSVGIMLYEFVTGRLPFRGNHWQVMSLNATAPPPPFAEANPRLRPLPGLEHAILRVLSKDRGQRPQSARELFEEVREAVEALRVAGPSAPTPAAREAFPVLPPPPDGTLPPTQPDVAGPPSIRMAPLIGRATEPEGRGPVARRWPPRARWVVLLVALAAAACWFVISNGASSKGGRPVPKGPALAGPGGSASPEGKPADFEHYWPDAYRPVEGYERGMPWPEKVRRTADEVIFSRFADGVYLPESFEPEAGADLVDGWPRVIVRDGARFVRIPEGPSWIMGAWDDPNAVDRPDAPAHPVLLSGYYLQESEVTNGQVEDYLARTDGARPADWEATFNRLKRKFGPEVARRQPAANVTRKLALGFCGWSGGQLPTEAQWEYAARSLGRKRRYSWGDAPDAGREQARVDSLDMTPAPVRSYPGDRTEQGVFDMTGNVKEMCRDAWVSSYKKALAAVRDPCAVADDPGAVEYAIRGAAFDSLAEECPATRRDKRPAAEPVEDLGFRLVVECPDTRKPR